MSFRQNRRRFRSTSFAAALLGTTFLFGASVPAFAQSDLEAENAELRSAVEDLMQEVQILKGMVLRQNERITAAEEAAPAKPAKMVSSGKEKVSLTVSGQVNRMLLHVDDGMDARTFHADNDRSSTRIAFKGKAKMDDEWTAGTNIEVEMESNASSKVTMDQTSSHGNASDRDVNFVERKLEVFFDSKRLGKFSIGQGAMASDGTVEQDLSGTSVITNAQYNVNAGDIRLTRSDTNTRTSTRVDHIFNNLDGLGREDRLRYDSPKFDGLQFSTSWAGETWDGGGENGDQWDVALRYGRKLGGFKVAAAIAAWDEDAGESGRGGSVSVLAPSGTSVTLAHSTEEVDGAANEPSITYAKLGQKLDAFKMGGTAVSVGYSTTADQRAAGNEGSYYDLALVQKVKDLGTELYAVYGVYSPDIVGVIANDVTVAAAGARIKF